ncbi:MAG: alanyl-tRNA synthetase, partial [Alphaproteobacteria bacterium]|nr:alanyl-tRNA synthetase [Alphaproteobacteria bacterium]
MAKPPVTSLNEIRATFLDFFAGNGHTIVPSSPLVPRNDPTLMFTNAGMVQFKNVFTGQETRPYARAATSQKCVRAGGKHNDLDNVGYTARHLTFFEMLGNFSFGDYFKENAIELAWRLITREYGIPASRLSVTVYADDDEAHGLWRKIAGLPDERIIRIATSDNFWSMGDTGPCGPCSEIFFDHGDTVPGGPPGSADQDGDRFVEIWNLVFMQYDQRGPGDRIALPRPSIDTGMGLERIGAVLQGKQDVFSTDVLRALIEAASDCIGGEPDGPMAASYRVIADHLRSVSFLIADGVLPSNEGRGYVLRRIMRRAMRHAEMLGAKQPVLWRIVPALVRQMGAHYQELLPAKPLIEETLKLEEERFRRTLERGLKLLEEETASLASGSVLSGDVAFKLYDTFGFPLDLTEDALRNRNISVDHTAFDAAMARQKAEARAAWAGSGEAASENVWFAVRERAGGTEFLGYESEEGEGLVSAIIVDGQEVREAGEGTEVQVTLNQTPFYAESGGQMGDTGMLIAASGVRVMVRDTKKQLGDLHVHVGSVRGGVLRLGDSVEARVDVARRAAIRANHSATHLLHAALRQVLGPHVTQKGSQVSADRLRFDFSHPKAMSEAELAETGYLVNAIVRQNTPVVTRLMAPDEAVAHGAMALFGEKYGDEVRVLSMGVAPSAEHRGLQPFSVELCGGTHVSRTGDMALIHILGESAVASGVRRIEALSGQAAFEYLASRERLVSEAAHAMRASPEELPARITALMEERKKQDREISELRKKLAVAGPAAGGESVAGAPEEVAGVKLVARIIEGVNPKELRGLVDAGKKSLGSGVVAFLAVNEGKGAL